MRQQTRRLLSKADDLQSQIEKLASLNIELTAQLMDRQRENEQLRERIQQLEKMFEDAIAGAQNDA